MEDDLREQEAFFRSGEVPSVEIIRENKQKINPSTDKPATEKTAPKTISSVGIIKEHQRESGNRDVVITPVEHGFPHAERIDIHKSRGSKKSLFKQSREGKDKKSAMEVKMQKESQAPSLVSSEFPFKTHSMATSGNGLMDGIHEEVVSMVSNMSQEEIQETLASFLSSMQNPDTMQLLQKRIARSSAKATPTNEIADTNDELKARRIVNEMDFSTILTEEDLAAAVEKLPRSEQLKLEWTHPIDSITNSNEPRFHFEGYLLPASASDTINVHSGLYNHGKDADRPGYTIEELSLICRSQVHGQRVLALKCLFNLLRRRSLARIAHQTLIPSILPVCVVRTLVFLLQRRETAEEVFLTMQCLEELCTCQEELHRRLILNLFYRGYEHAYVQDPEALRFQSEEEELEEKDPFSQKNCSNLFTMLFAADVLNLLFSCLSEFERFPAVVNVTLRFLRVLIESDERFSKSFYKNDTLVTQFNDYCTSHLSPSPFPSFPALPSLSSTSSSSSTTSLRLFILLNHPQSEVSALLHLLLLIEAFIRQSRDNALHLLHSPILPLIKQWLILEPASYPVDQLNVVLEGVLSVWRLMLMYGFDLESIDPFLPSLLRIAQFAAPPVRTLVWSFFEITVVSKKDVSSSYFVDFCNTLIQLVTELLNSDETPISVQTAAIHFVATYVGVVNEAREQWEASEELLQSLQQQVLQLGYALMHHPMSHPQSLFSSQSQVATAWNALDRQPNLISSPNPSSSLFTTTSQAPFSPSELTFLQHADTFYSLVRVSFEGVQNSRRFAAMLRESGFVDSLVDLALWEGWNSQPIKTPHSASFTYVPRASVLAQAYAALLLLSLLPLESKDLKNSKIGTRAKVWKACWKIVRLMLPGDEYVVLELIVQALLDPTSVKMYVEGRNPDAALFVDLDEVTSVLVQQIGEGSLVEHSQALHLNSFAERQSLQLLPYRIAPSLPFLPHWFLMPLIKLRFRTIGEAPSKSPFVASTEKQVVSLLTFVRELEMCSVCPLEEEDRAMRCYGLLHICFAGNDIVSSPAVYEAVHELIPIYLKSEKVDGCCPIHNDCIHKIEEIVPKKEVLSFLEKCCQCIIDEYYYCPLVMEILILFTYPCRDWNERVLILNFFYDHNYARLLLETDYNTLQGNELSGRGMDVDIGELLNEVLSQELNGESCIWESKEEMIEMYIRYLEQVSSQGKVNRRILILNHFVIQVLHYIRIHSPRYLYFHKQLEELIPEISVDALIF